MMNDSERDVLLARLDERVMNIADDVHSLKQGMYGSDGTGGLCGEISKLKNRQSRWLGRDGAIVAGISAAISVAAVAIGLRGGS